MNEKTVIVSKDYNRVDGRNAYTSDIKRLTLGEPIVFVVEEFCYEGLL